MEYKDYSKKIISMTFELDAGKDLYWIPKINKATYGGMESAISKAMIEYLKKLQTRACSGRILWTGSTQQREVF